MQPLIEHFKACYQDLSRLDLNRLDDIYSQDIVFRDPIHELRGLIALRDYMAGLCDKLTECRFEYLDQLTAHNMAYIKWNMHFRHPRLGADVKTVRGISQVHFQQRIFFHEDIYDMGAMIYEHVPVVGAVTRWLKRRLGQRGGRLI